MSSSSVPSLRLWGVLGPWLLPLGGLCLLACPPPVLAPQTGTRWPAEVGSSTQPRSARLNKTQRILLGRQLAFYRLCLARRQPACVRGAADSYNEVAADTDPSAFDGTAFPRRLPR